MPELVQFVHLSYWCTKAKFCNTIVTCKLYDGGKFSTEPCMDIVFDEMFEELEVIYDFDDEFTGGRESALDFIDDKDDDSSLEL